MSEAVLRPVHESDPPRWAQAALAAILAAAAILRFWGIRYGLPHIYYPDECLTIFRALAMGSGDLNPHFFEYPALMTYFLAFVYGLSFVIAYTTGLTECVEDFALGFIRDPSFFFLCARAIVALSGIATVWLSYRLGRKVFGWPVGLAAAALLATHPVHVAYSHFMKVEGPQGLFTLLALLAALRLLVNPSTKHYLLAGTLAGICTAIKYPGCLVFASVVAAHLIANWQSTRLHKLILHKKLWLSAAAMTVVFLATNPFVVLDFRTFWADVAFQAQASSIVWIGEPGSSLWHWGRASLEGQGFVLSLAGMAGVLYYWLRGRAEHLVVLTFVIVFFLIVGGQPLHQVHWMIPIFGPFCVFAAAMLFNAPAFALRRAPSATVVGIMLVAIGAFENGVKSAAEDRILTLPDTRTEAKEWIEKHIPAGSTILMDRGRFLAGYTAPILPNRATIERLYLSDESAQGGVGEPPERHASTFYRLLIRASEGHPTYNIIPILHDPLGGRTEKRRRPAVKSLDDYLRENLDYIITSSRHTDPYFAPDQTPEGLAYSLPFIKFYRSLERRCRLLKEFSADMQHRQGPTIRIYQAPRP